MSDTPRTDEREYTAIRDPDVEPDRYVVDSDFARELERELAEEKEAHKKVWDEHEKCLVALAKGHDRANQLLSLVQRLVEWSDKWPVGQIHCAVNESQHHAELNAIETEARRIVGEISHE